MHVIKYMTVSCSWPATSESFRIPSNPFKSLLNPSDPSLTAASSANLSAAERWSEMLDRLNWIPPISWVIGRMSLDRGDMPVITSSKSKSLLELAQYMTVFRNNGPRMAYVPVSDENSSRLSYLIHQLDIWFMIFLKWCSLKCWCVNSGSCCSIFWSFYNWFRKWSLGWKEKLWVKINWWTLLQMRSQKPARKYSYETVIRLCLLYTAWVEQQANDGSITVNARSRGFALAISLNSWPLPYGDELLS